MRLDEIKKEWKEYNDEFENSNFMDIEKHISMAYAVGYLISKIDQYEETLKTLQNSDEVTRTIVKKKH